MELIQDVVNRHQTVPAARDEASVQEDLAIFESDTVPQDWLSWIREGIRGMRERRK